jgi:hypothetical protein
VNFLVWNGYDGKARVFLMRLDDEYLGVMSVLRLCSGCDSSSHLSELRSYVISYCIINASAYALQASRTPEECLM